MLLDGVWNLVMALNPPRKTPSQNQSDNKSDVWPTSEPQVTQVGDNFGVSLRRSQTSPNRVEPPLTSQNLPELPREFSDDFPRTPFIVDLQSDPEDQKGESAINLGNLVKFCRIRPRAICLCQASRRPRELFMLGRLAVPKHFKYWGKS